MVAVRGEAFPVDIRIDSSSDAISELKLAHSNYMPMHDYYLRRAGDPSDLPSQDEWVRKK